MRNIVLVGVGGIGFRHFQALLNCSHPINLYVIDLSNDALQRCRDEFASKHKIMNVFFSDNYDFLPEIIDVLVIATASKPRCSVFENIVSKSDVKNVIFEKILFPKLDEYEIVDKILSDKHINAYVNCPGRLFPGYKELKSKIDITKGCDVFIAGSNWGLSCNAIHFIDQVGFLFDTYDCLKISPVLLDGDIIESRRNGYIEFTGRIICSVGNNINIIMDSYGNGDIPLRITLINGSRVYNISEAEGWIVTSEGDYSSKEQFEIMYQSQLTDKVVDRLLKERKCDLTRYADTKQWHIELLSAFMKKTGITDLCPIT